MNKWMMLLLMAILTLSTAHAQTKTTGKKAVPTRKSPLATRNTTKKAAKSTRHTPPHPENCDKPYALVCFQRVDDMPEFPGGMAKLKEFLLANVHYPKTCIDDSITGKVIVTFVVDTDGSITQAKVLRGAHKELNKEALRVVNLMPKWKPGRIGGKPARIRYSFPINFIF